VAISADLVKFRRFFLTCVWVDEIIYPEIMTPSSDRRTRPYSINVIVRRSYQFLLGQLRYGLIISGEAQNDHNG
jgi:hypothetical protein